MVISKKIRQFNTHCPKTPLELNEWTITGRQWMVSTSKRAGTLWLSTKSRWRNGEVVMLSTWDWLSYEEVFLHVRTMVSGWWFQTWLLFSISYMGCHPSHWLIFFKMVIAPPTRYTCMMPEMFFHKNYPVVLTDDPQFSKDAHRGRSPWWSLVVLGGTKARAGKNEVTYINGFPVGVGDSQPRVKFGSMIHTIW